MVNQRIHPQTIIAGWRKACETAKNALESVAVDNGFVFGIGL